MGSGVGESRVLSLRFRALSRFALLCVKLRLAIEICIIYTSIEALLDFEGVSCRFFAGLVRMSHETVWGNGRDLGKRQLVAWFVRISGVHNRQFVPNRQKMASGLSFGMADIYAKARGLRRSNEVAQGWDAAAAWEEFHMPTNYQRRMIGRDALKHNSVLRKDEDGDAPRHLAGNHARAEGCHRELHGLLQRGENQGIVRRPAH